MMDNTNRVLACLAVLLGSVLLASCNLFAAMRENREFAAMLGDLGVDTRLGAREDPNGDELPVDYNPLTSKVGTLFKKCEIYAAGSGHKEGSTYTGKDQYLLEDGSDDSPYELLYQEAADDWADYNKKAVAADVDGDGKDEIVMIVLLYSLDRIRVRVVDRDWSGVFSVVDRPDISCDLSDITGTLSEEYTRRDLAAGDGDGDGRDELYIAVGERLIVLDDASTGYSILADKSIYPQRTNQCLRVEAGDLDLDGRDELVVINGSYGSGLIADCIIYDDLEKSPTLDEVLDEISVKNEVGGTLRGMRWADAAIGRLDATRVPKIAVHGKGYNTSRYYTFVIDNGITDARPSFEMLQTYMSDTADEGDYPPTPVACGDLDGDGVDEIIAGDDVYGLQAGELGYKWANEALAPSNAWPPYRDALCVGDVLGDHREEVVFIAHHQDQGEAKLRIWGVEELTGDFKHLHDISVQDRIYPTLCLPNVDDDSAVVKFVNHDVKFTEPRILAVLCSPPYHAGIDQNTDDSGTYFGTLKGQAVEEGKAHGFHVDVTVGYHWETPLFGSLGSSDLRVTVSNNFDWGTYGTHEITEEFGYSCSAGEDVVVFTCIPFDVYYYEVLSSPTPANIGDMMSINIPRQARGYHAEREYYNAHNGSGFDVDPSVLVHTIGDPWSYHDTAERDAEKAAAGGRGLFSTFSRTIGPVAGGTTIISIEDLVAETDTYDYELDCDVSFETVSGGIVVGGGLGYKYGYSYSSTTTEGTHIEGEVGDISPDDWQASLGFDWGLMAYPFEDAASAQKFTVVTYWVNP